MPFLGKHGYRLVPGIKGDADNLGAFGYEKTLVRVKPVAKLCLGKSHVRKYPRVLDICNVDNHSTKILKILKFVYKLRFY